VLTDLAPRCRSAASLSPQKTGASPQKPWSFRDGPKGRAWKTMNTCFANVFVGLCSWIPGARALPAPRNDS